MLQCVTIEFRQGSIYVVNSHFSRPPNRHKSSNSTKPFRPIFTISESFQMRYCMTLYLKGHQKYDRSKLKVQLLLSKFRLFNFDLSYLLYPLRYRVTQYLIRKLLDMVKMGIEGLAVAALLISVKASQKLKIYYINRALSKLNCYALYLVDLYTLHLSMYDAQSWFIKSMTTTYELLNIWPCHHDLLTVGHQHNAEK